MHTEDLQKLFHLIKSVSTKIEFCRVIIHTSAVIKVFDLQDDEDIQSHPDFEAAFGQRHASGGTSHACVFENISSWCSNSVTDYIYISLSDNYSDIESCIHKYPSIQRMTKYWLTPSDGRLLNTSIVGGTNIVTP
jgi:hypothetical protein